jgi:diadenosine tetraphosphate (Ap4A) HIT family hydrolase
MASDKSEHRHRCILCEIADGSVAIDADKKIYGFAEDEKQSQFVAYQDLNPWAPKHIVVYPRKHVGVNDKNCTEYADIRKNLYEKALKLAEDLNETDYFEIYTEDGHRYTPLNGSITEEYLPLSNEEHYTQNGEHLHFHIRCNLDRPV